MDDEQKQVLESPATIIGAFIMPKRVDAISVDVPLGLENGSLSITITDAPLDIPLIKGVGNASERSCVVIAIEPSAG